MLIVSLKAFYASKFDLNAFYDISLRYQYERKDYVMKMITRILLIVFGLALGGQGLAQENLAETENFQEDQNQIKFIISDQIAAFVVTDVDRAYSHAADSIKTIFPNAKIFGTMVKQSYPMIWNPKSFEFLSASTSSIGVFQRVMFTDQESNMHFFDYALEKNGGRWVISGVYLVPGEKGV